jgi:hypothetical protein
MANSTASIFIKPTVAFNRGDTFVFRSWVCTADGVGSFQRRLTMTPNLKTGLVTLPEVITGNLTDKFGEILLYNQHANFESGSASNSNSTSPWVTACESVLSHRVLMPHSTSTSHMASATLAGPMWKLSLHAGLARRSSPISHRTPIPPPATTQTPPTSLTSGRILEPEPENFTTEQPLSGPTTGLVIISTPADRFVYWPDRKHTDLTDGNSHYGAYLDSLPFQEGTPLAPTEKHTPTGVASTDSSLGTPDRQVFLATGETP